MKPYFHGLANHLKKGWRLLVWLVVCVLAAHAGPVKADFRKGIDAYSRGDYATALEEFHQAAEHNDADAQYWLGYMFDTGKGVPENPVEAAKWYLG
ncbi:MAG: hypothetical protein V3T80_05660, partial [Kiloniellales bacterium]